MFIIQTERLLLRDLLEGDWPVMHRLRSDPKVTRFLDYIRSENEAETQTWLRNTIKHNQCSPRLSYNLTIVHQADGKIIGWIGIGRADNPVHGDLDFAYALLPDFWGQGYTTEALDALLTFAFRQPDVQRIFGECAVENIASRRVMEKVGLRLEQAASPAHQATAQPQQELRYSIIAAHWQQRQ
jgi:ribosomal-protein-alanine N-acetyltransferase